MGIKAFFSKLFGGSAAEETAKAEKPCCCSDRKDNGKKARAPKASPEEQSAKLRDLEGFVNYVVKALVDYPEDVAVSSESVKEGKMIKIRKDTYCIHFKRKENKETGKKDKKNGKI